VDFRRFKAFSLHFPFMNYEQFLYKTRLEYTKKKKLTTYSLKWLYKWTKKTYMISFRQMFSGWCLLLLDLCFLVLIFRCLQYLELIWIFFHDCFTSLCTNGLGWVFIFASQNSCLTSKDHHYLGNLQEWPTQEQFISLLVLHLQDNEISRKTGLRLITFPTFPNDLIDAPSARPTSNDVYLGTRSWNLFRLRPT